MCRQRWRKGHSFFCAVWLVQRGYCLNIFCFARLALSQSFGQKEWAFVGAFFLCTSIGISEFPAFPVPRPIYMSQKQNPRNSPLSCSLGPKVCSCLLCAFQSLLVFVLYKMPKIFSCPQREGQGEVHLFHLPRSRSLQMMDFLIIPRNSTRQSKRKMKLDKSHNVYTTLHKNILNELNI